MEDNQQQARRLTRRQALGAGVVAAGGAATATMAGCGSEDPAAAYPRHRIGRLNQALAGPVPFDYPLKGQSSLLLDLGFEVPGGAGPHGSLVAYSIACQHMGCPVNFRAEDQHFVCPCHQTMYNPAQEGVVVQGVAQRALPRILLDADHDNVYAIGVQGLIFGWRDNLGRSRTAA